MFKTDQSKRTKTDVQNQIAIDCRLPHPNERGLIRDSAYAKKSLIVDIMEKWKYDLVLLQETNRNKNSVDAVQTERAGVGIVVHDVKLVSGRLMSIILRPRDPNLYFSSC